MCRTVFLSIISSSRLYIQQYLFDSCMYSLELLMMDRNTVRNMWSVIPKYNKFDTMVHLVGFTIEIILRCTAL